MGDSVGQSSDVPGETDRRKGLSVASRSDLRCIGDLDTKVATGICGRGLSVGDGKASFLTG